MVKMAKKCQKLVMKLVWTPQKTFFCIKDKKLYIKNVGQLPGLLKKVLTDLIRPNMSKNVVKKCQKIFKKKLFGALPKIGDWI